MASNNENGSYPIAVPKNTVWTSVFELGVGGGAIGVTEDGIWVVDSGEGRLLDICAMDGTHHTLVLLETRISEVKKQLVDLARTEPSYATAIWQFPYREIVKGGMKQGSDYWADLAISWYPEMSNEDRQSLQPLLLQVSQAKWASQKTRHVALKKHAAQKRAKELTPDRKNTLGDSWN